MYLVLAQFSEFIKPQVTKDTAVYMDMNHDQYVMWNLDIVLPRAPCAAFDVILKTGYTYRVNKEIEGLDKVCIDGKTRATLSD